MAFIPQNNAGINVIRPKAGSGLTSVTVANVDTISTDNFIAGTGMSLVRNTTNNTLTFNTSALGSGVVSVTEQFPQGSGVLVTSSAGPAVNVTIKGTYQAGNGISVTPSTTPGNQDIFIGNTMDITSAAGSGIAITQASAGSDAQIAANLTAGSGIAIAAGVGTAKQISNTMDVTGSGAGISVVQAGTGQDVTISNTGVTSIATTGAGLSTSGATGALTLQNTGVTSLAAGNGVGVSGATGAITVSNTVAVTGGNGIQLNGVSGNTVTGQNMTISTLITGGAGISVTPGNNMVVTNTGVRSLTAGSGITLSGSTGAITISASTGVAPKFYYCSTLIGPQMINNGNSTIVDVFMSPALRALLANATPSSTGDLLIQTSLGFTTNATPPGGAISVQVEYNSIIPTQANNDPNLYAQGYNSWGTTPIAIRVALSEFAGYSTLMNLGFIITNNYGATIQAAILSPAIITYVPDGTDIY